jgi:hypothetical protein
MADVNGKYGAVWLLIKRKEKFKDMLRQNRDYTGISGGLIKKIC